MSTPLTSMPNVGPAVARKLARLGVVSPGDLAVAIPTSSKARAGG